MKKTILITLLLSSTFIFAQQSPFLVRSTTSMAGSSQNLGYGGKNFLVQQSVGQASPAGTVFENNFVARQGFIQPYILVKMSNEPDLIGLGVYPNPVINELYIELDEEYVGNMYVSLYDYRGRLVAKETYSEQRIVIFDVRYFAQGTYFLKVVIGNKQRVVQINKQR
ncbi:MAG: T9SS type A sorting domain-containing protein [Flavobacteriales bacterium]